MADVKKPLVYVVDDDTRLAETLCGILAKAGYETLAFHDGLGVVAATRERRPDAILLDLMLPDIDGIEVIRQVQAIVPGLPIVMLSGQGSIKAALEATRLGAYDFLEKPPDANRVRLTIANALARGRLERHVGRLQGELADRYQMVGTSPALQRVRDLIAKTAPTSANVLITGESGVGKELVARALHARSQRVGEAFVALNCAAIPRELIESELFGHEKGAFTGAVAQRKGKLEEADNATLFLDEIGDMPLNAQAKLLRFLEESEIQRVGGSDTFKLDIRVVAATNKNLPENVSRGTFREDLFHRLNVVAIPVPSLRERRDDVEPLALTFLERYCRRHNRALQLAPDCMDALRAYDWPGNVRELRNVVERIVVLASSSPVEPDELSAFLDSSSTIGAQGNGTLKAAYDRAEREAVEHALAASGGVMNQATRLLGVERTTLYRLIKKHNLRPTDEAVA